MVAVGKILQLGAAAVCGTGLFIGIAALPATAEPETPLTYPSGSSANRVSGLGFDTCSAPSLAALKACQQLSGTCARRCPSRPGRLCGLRDLSTTQLER